MKLNIVTRINKFTWYYLGQYLTGNIKYLAEGYVKTYTNKLNIYER